MATPSEASSTTQPAGSMSEVVTATTASSCARSRVCSLTGRRASSWTLRKTTLAKTDPCIRQGCRVCRTLQRNLKSSPNRKRSTPEALGDTVDAGLRALLVGGAAARAAGRAHGARNTDRADQILARANRQSARRGGDLVEMQRAGAAAESRGGPLAVLAPR